MLCVHDRELLGYKGRLLRFSHVTCTSLTSGYLGHGAWCRPEQEGPSPFSGAFLSPIVVSGGFEGLSDVSV